MEGNCPNKSSRTIQDIGPSMFIKNIIVDYLQPGSSRPIPLRIFLSSVITINKTRRPSLVHCVAHSSVLCGASGAYRLGVNQVVRFNELNNIAPSFICKTDFKISMEICASSFY